jgi:hypothetical protein
MYLVTDPDTISGHPSPSRWIATVIIDELESLAVDCREARAGHRGESAEHNRQSIHSLDQAAETCDEIVQLLRTEYLSGFPVRREAPSRASQHPTTATQGSVPGRAASSGRASSRGLLSSAEG